MFDAVVAKFKTWEFVLLVLVVAMLVAASALVPGFTRPFSISTGVATFAPAALMALPLALLVIVRDIDISVASIAGLSSVAAGLAIQAGQPVWAVVAFALVTGLVCGAVNGFFVAVLGLPALLVTLGTLALFRGLCYVLLGGTPISPLPDFFTALGTDDIPGLVIPWAIVPFAVLAVVFGIVLHRSTVGRRIYAIGGNPETARYSGIHVTRIRFLLFVVSGVVSALAGMINMGITSQVAPDGALGLELDVITVVFLAGVSVLGGKGRITGVVLASILILALRKSLQLLNVSGYTQGIAVGGVLIASLLVTNLSRQFIEARRERRPDASVDPVHV
ncbi:ABC transporter permease [Mycobacterium sp. NPDC006124]|uniref:ABC transporter permease n=1 Tax=Mycobacterium sp. NPDC006124 TaxID=3156729 RepID=UPI0033B11CB4